MAFIVPVTVRFVTVARSPDVKRLFSVPALQVTVLDTCAIATDPMNKKNTKSKIDFLILFSLMLVLFRLFVICGSLCIHHKNLIFTLKQKNAQTILWRELADSNL